MYLCPLNKGYIFEREKMYGILMIFVDFCGKIYMILTDFLLPGFVSG